MRKRNRSRMRPKRNFNIIETTALLYPIIFLILRRAVLVSILDSRSSWGIDDPRIIDIMLLWVNGSDPRWCERRDKAAKEYNLSFSTKYNEQRFIDHNELKWAMRSIEKFAPWVHKIHILTDKQYPNWMKRKHPKIHWVDHETVFTPGFHSFNSIAMQFSIPRVPGISRRVILMDDDYLFMNKVKPDDFFDSKCRTKIHGWKESKPYNYTEDMSTKKKCSNYSTGSIFNVGSKKAHRAIYILYNRTDALYFAHVHMPVDIVVLNRLISEISIERTILFPFRTCGDYQMQNLYLNFANAIGANVLQANNRKAILKENQLAEMYSMRTFPKLVCVNVYNKTFYDVFLPKLFPKKSSFEI